MAARLAASEKNRVRGICVDYFIAQPSYPRILGTQGRHDGGLDALVQAKRADNGASRALLSQIPKASL